MSVSSSLPPISSSRCVELLNIINGNPNEDSIRKDIIVPIGERHTFNLDPGGYLNCRDIIILGELHITIKESKNNHLEKGEIPPNLSARNIYNFGVFSADDINLKEGQIFEKLQVPTFRVFLTKRIEEASLIQTKSLEK